MATPEELREALNAVEDPELMMGIVDLAWSTTSRWTTARPTSASR